MPKADLSKANRIVDVPASTCGWDDAKLGLYTNDGESGSLVLVVGTSIIARGHQFRAPQYGASLLEMSDAKLAGMFGSFLAHALESRENHDGWSVLSDDASDWTDALTMMDEL